MLLVWFLVRTECGFFGSFQCKLSTLTFLIYYIDLNMRIYRLFFFLKKYWWLRARAKLWITTRRFKMVSSRTEIMKTGCNQWTLTGPVFDFKRQVGVLSIGFAFYSSNLGLERTWCSKMENMWTAFFSYTNAHPPRADMTIYYTIRIKSRAERS